MKALFTTLYSLFLAAIVGIGLLLMASLAPISGLGIKVVKSGSMEPAIKTGGIVVIKSAPSYAVGDIVTFGADTKTQIPTTHRIVGVSAGENPVFTTKGDANDAPDNANTRFSDIRGKVIFTAPYVGYVLDFAKKPIGFFLLIGIPAIMIVIDEIVKIVREVRRMRVRRKKGGSDHSDPGMPSAPITTLIPPIVSSKPRNIDGIQLRMYAREVLHSNVMQTNKKPYFTSIAILFLAFFMTTYLMPVGKTLSYFSDIETALANTFTAGSVNLQLGNVVDAVAYELEEKSAHGNVNGSTGEVLAFSFNTYLGTPSGPFSYIVKGIFDESAPAECTALQLQAHFGSYSYEGPVSAFISEATSTMGAWTFEISDSPGASRAQALECEGSLILYAEPHEVGGVLKGIFSDTETYALDIYLPATETASKKMVSDAAAPAEPSQEEAPQESVAGTPPITDTAEEGASENAVIQVQVPAAPVTEQPPSADAPAETPTE